MPSTAPFHRYHPAAQATRRKLDVALRCWLLGGGILMLMLELPPLVATLVGPPAFWLLVWPACSLLLLHRRALRQTIDQLNMRRRTSPARVSRRGGQARRLKPQSPAMRLPRAA